MLTITEYFLNIDMIDGVKQSVPTAGLTHTLTTYTISDVRGNNKSSQIGGQTSTPTTQLLGENPESVTITGKIGDVKRMNDIVSHMGDKRIVAAIYNLFLVGSVLDINAITNDDPDSVGIKGHWIVDGFTIRRNINNRNNSTYELNLLKWYDW